MNFPRHILDGRIRIIHADEMLFIWSAGWLWWHSIHFLNINGHEATWLSIEVFFLLQRVTGNSLSLLLLLPRIHIWSWGKLSRSPSSPTWCPECNFWVGNWLWIGRCVSIIEPSNAQVLHTHTHTPLWDYFKMEQVAKSSAFSGQRSLWESNETYEFSLQDWG